jgi:hypothetical protein
MYGKIIEFGRKLEVFAAISMDSDMGRISRPELIDSALNLLIKKTKCRIYERSFR